MWLTRRVTHLTRFTARVTRSLILSEALLLVLLAGFTLSFFVFQIDSYGPFLSLLTGVVAIRVMVTGAPDLALPKLVPIGFLFLLVLVAAHFLIGDPGATLKALSRLVYMLVLAVAIVLLHRSGGLERYSPWLLGLGVMVHHVALRGFGRPHGMFENAHFLSEFALLTIPAFVFWARYRRPSWQKAVFLAFALMGVDLLVHTHSTPAYLALATALVTVLLLFSSRREALIAFSAVTVCILALWTTDYEGLIGRAWQEIANEERVHIWRDTWVMIQGNSPLQWILGNGTEQFKQEFPRYSNPDFSWVYFPHNHLLELLYANGAPAMLAAGALLVMLTGVFLKALFQKDGNRIQAPGRFLFFTYSSWLVMAFLVFPFYAKGTLYPFGLLLGTILVFLSESARGTRGPAQTSPADRAQGPTDQDDAPVPLELGTPPQTAD